MSEGSNDGKARVQIKIDRDFDRFTDEEQGKFLRAFSELADISGEVNVVSKERGCVLITLELDAVDAERLMTAADGNRLDTLDVLWARTVKRVPNPVETDRPEQSFCQDSASTELSRVDDGGQFAHDIFKATGASISRYEGDHGLLAVTTELLRLQRTQRFRRQLEEIINWLALRSSEITHDKPLPLSAVRAFSFDALQTLNTFQYLIEADRDTLSDQPDLCVHARAANSEAQRYRTFFKHELNDLVHLYDLSNNGFGDLSTDLSKCDDMTEPSSNGLLVVTLLDQVAAAAMETRRRLMTVASRVDLIHRRSSAALEIACEALRSKKQSASTRASGLPELLAKCPEATCSHEPEERKSLDEYIIAAKKVLCADTYEHVKGLHLSDLDPTSSCSRHVPIDEVFVCRGLLHLDSTQPNALSDASREWDELWIDSSPDSNLSDSIRRITERPCVIIGEPGSGKSTLAKYLVKCLLAQRHERPPQASKIVRFCGMYHPLPILLSVVEFAEYLDHVQSETSFALAADSPQWIIEYLRKTTDNGNPTIRAAAFAEELLKGSVLLVLDGMDEAPPGKLRNRILAMVNNWVTVYENCRVLVTTRPFLGEDAFEDFQFVKLQPLDSSRRRELVEKYGLIFNMDGNVVGQEQLRRLSALLETEREIADLASNPRMLIALVSCHQKGLADRETKSQLYDQMIRWLLTSRFAEADLAKVEDSFEVLQKLALAALTRKHTSNARLPWHEVTRIAGTVGDNGFSPDCTGQESRLLDECVNSGLLIRWGEEFQFVHRSLQEYLVARWLAVSEDGVCDEMLTRALRASLCSRSFVDEWREVISSLATLLHEQGDEHFDKLVSLLLNSCDVSATIIEKARCLCLTGDVVGELKQDASGVSDPRYAKLIDEVLNKVRTAEVSRLVAIELAELIGRAGDPRFSKSRRQENWIGISVKEFGRGSLLGRYPVTVAEYREFVEDDGYRCGYWWREGGFGEWDAPEEWDEQSEHPNRPVVSVSFYEAAAYARWAGCRLPTEAEWECAARGSSGCLYPWGMSPPTPERANYDLVIGHATPVGVYPSGATDTGLEDMAGNVWEWCADAHELAEESEGLDLNPGGRESHRFHILRGGSWKSPQDECRCAHREWRNASTRDNAIGFRVLRDVRNDECAVTLANQRFFADR